MAKSIQFQGRDKLIDGFIKTHAKSWSVWDGRDMLTKGVGSEMLDTFLEALEEGSTNTIYTLKIYEDIEDAKSIKMGTDPDGSFKFLLSGNSDEIMHPIYSESNNKNRLFQRLDKLEENQLKIAEALAKVSGTEEEEEETEPETIGSIAMDVLKNPSKLKELAESFAFVKNIFTPGITAQLPTPHIGSVTSNQPVTDEERIIRAQAAINTLDKNDPNFLEHLEQLANISENDKPQFQILTSLLDKMKK